MRMKANAHRAATISRTIGQNAPTTPTTHSTIPITPRPPARNQVDYFVSRRASALHHRGSDQLSVAAGQDDHPHIQHAEIQTTQIYLHADLALKEQALAKAAPIDSKPGRYRPPTRLPF